MPRPEPRYQVDFQLRIALHDRTGAMRQVAGRCTDLSASGLQIEMRDPVEVRSTVTLSSEQFGRMGHASVRYCRRISMKYVVGLHFSVQFKLADPARGEPPRARPGRSS